MCKFQKHLKKEQLSKKLFSFKIMTNYHQENQEGNPAYQYLEHCPIQLSILPKTAGRRDLGHSYAPLAMV